MEGRGGGTLRLRHQGAVFAKVARVAVTPTFVTLAVVRAIVRAMVQ